MNSKVRNDSGIVKIEGLKGKVLATTGFGAASDIALRTMLTRHGLNPTKDVTIIQAAYANMPAILKDRKADLVTAIPPFAFDPDLTAISRTLFTGKDAMGPTEKIFWAARKDFLANNRAAMIDFIDGFHARAALVPRSGEPARRVADRHGLHQSRARPLRLHLDAARLFPRSARHAQSRRAAAFDRCAGRSSASSKRRST